MRDLILDMTPVCINKTAIYHIARQTWDALGRDYRLQAQVRGEIADAPEADAPRRAVAEAFYRDVGAWASVSAHSDEILLRPQTRDDRRPILFFDPIYTLYGPLLEDDVVLVLDLTPLTNPEWHNPVVSACYERAYRKLASSHARIATISHHCTAILRANFSIPESEIVTVPLYLRDLPHDAPRKPEADLESGRFFLFVGSLETRKNLVGLIRAFALSGLAQEGWKLALAGGRGAGWERIVAAADEIEGVRALGFVSDEELAWLYQNAAAFAYPSYLEGFGLPLLEAMAHGLPCMASITGASSEVCLDLGVLVDPYHMGSIVDGLRRCADLSARSDATAKRRLMDRAAWFTFERYLATLRTALPA